MFIQKELQVSFRILSHFRAVEICCFFRNLRTCRGSSGTQQTTNLHEMSQSVAFLKNSVQPLLLKVHVIRCVQIMYTKEIAWIHFGTGLVSKAFSRVDI